MTTILALSGSLRAASFNSALARAAARLAPPGATIELASIRDIPLSAGDLEAASGLPAAVTALKERVAAADGLLLVSPEYNGSIPGVMKNAIDWMSRPAADIGRVFRGRPVVICGATPGPSGTRLAQTAWLPVFRQLGLVPWFGAQLGVSDAGKAFDGEGNLIDEAVAKRLSALVNGFVEFVARVRG